jgi:beta-lactamase regulating signal transducer with metallopeptidase domain
VAAPALAASPEPSQDTPFSSRALSKALADAPASAKAAKAETPAKRAAKTQAAKPGFFQTRTGILVLSAFAVGTGFALYSAQNDRIHGAAR